MHDNRRTLLMKAGAFAAAAMTGLAAQPASASDAIKIVHLFARKRGLTPRQFTDYWLKVHAPMTLKAPDPFSGYVLAFVRHLPQDVAPDAIIGMSESYSPSTEARDRTLASPEAKAMQADQQMFVGRSRTFTTREHVFVPRQPVDGAEKHVLIAVRKRGLSHADFLRLWLKVYGPMAQGTPGMDGFVLSEILAEKKDDDPLPLPGEVDGIQEVWWHTTPPDSPQRRALEAQAARFMDMDRSVHLLVKDNVFIAPRYG